MHQKNINKTTWIKKTLIKSLLKAVYQMIIFLANMLNKFTKTFAIKKFINIF